MAKLKSIVVDGITYIPESSIPQSATKKENMEYKIVRTYSAGVFAGWLESRNGREVVLRDARRLWYWSGAASLSQLAMEGVKNPDSCKFAMAVDKVELLEAIEVLDVTKQAQDNILSIPEWKK